VGRRNVIYVLDDDPDMLKGLGRLLNVHGFIPKLFQSANDFLASVKNDDDVLCLLLDVHLDGTSGIDVKRRLTRSGLGIPVIFITANDNVTTRRLIEEVGCIAYLPKPFTAKSLVEAIGLADRHDPATVGPRD
jgi:FixJ family two-component response regulator